MKERPVAKWNLNGDLFARQGVRVALLKNDRHVRGKHFVDRLVLDHLLGQTHGRQSSASGAQIAKGSIEDDDRSCRKLLDDRVGARCAQLFESNREVVDFDWSSDV